MRVLEKYNQTTYASMGVVMIVGFLVNFWLVRYFIYDTTDDVLNEYRIDIEEYATDHDELHPLYFMGDKLTAVRAYETEDVPEGLNETIRDTLIYSHYEEEMVVYRKMDFAVLTLQHNYVVTLMLPAFEEDDLAAAVFVLVMMLGTLFLIFTTTTHKMVNRRIFQPFGAMLDVMRTYRLDDPVPVKLEDGDIDELSEMNRILTGMMTKIGQDYNEMKEFLEYTSHEMKTPLAVIQLKLEEMNQQELPDAYLAEQLGTIQTLLKRIICFNQSLLFMAKIRNNQYAETEHVVLNAHVTQFLQLYEELLAMRGIQVETELSEDFGIDIHPQLGERLIQNIMTNAFVHNRDGGMLTVHINSDRMVFSNSFTGTLPEGDLFEKYRHTSDKKESTGLGLAIVKSICQKHHLEVEYAVKDQVFILTVTRQTGRATEPKA